MRKALRYLRIAWSVGCGILCLLVIVLWVRTYSIAEGINYNKGQTYVRIFSQMGVVGLGYESSPSRSTFQNRAHFERLWYKLRGEPYEHLTPFSWNRRPEGTLITVPVWCCESILVLLAALPWFRLRFSLRTLLIAMTLAAIVLGAIVFSMQ
jgi:hypothetical protein